MLSAQLVGRLLPEIEHSDNIRSPTATTIALNLRMRKMCLILLSYNLTTELSSEHCFLLTPIAQELAETM